MNTNRRDWDLAGDGTRTPRQSEEEPAICVAARRTRPIRCWYRVPLFWERARQEQEQALHMHAEAWINQRLVHIDYVSLASVRHRVPEFGLPSGVLAQEGIRDQKDDASSDQQSIVEICIFVDGRLAGVGGRCDASPDEGGRSLPAVAIVERALVISVDDACDEHGPVVELWDVV